VITLTLKNTWIIFLGPCHFALCPSVPKFARLVVVGDERDACGLLTIALMHGGAEAKMSTGSRSSSKFWYSKSLKVRT
jgi:hypothetical protein